MKLWNVLKIAAEEGDLRCQKIVEDLSVCQEVKGGKTPGVATKHAGSYAKIAKRMMSTTKGTKKDDVYHKKTKTLLLDTIKHLQKQIQNANKQVMCVCLGWCVCLRLLLLIDELLVLVQLIQARQPISISVDSAVFNLDQQSWNEGDCLHCKMCVACD